MFHLNVSFSFLSTHRSDCINILRKCGNASLFSDEDAIETMCSDLSPDEDQSSCIAIDTYLSKYMTTQIEWIAWSVFQVMSLYP